MTIRDLAAFCRVAIATLLLGTLQSSCGGRASGSAQAIGGSSNVAGSAAGGSAQAGNGQSGASAGAGSYEDRCVANLQGEVCDAAGVRYHHDATTHQCQAFIYGGCAQGANNYQTLADCEGTCGSPSTTSCDTASDCAVSDAVCCTFCDGGLMFPDQFVAYNQAYAPQHLCNVTLTELPAGDPPANPGPSAPVACGCPAVQPGQSTKKYFVADCVQGTCAVVDLRDSPLTACTTDADCRLRSGTSCCEGCVDDGNYVAVRKGGSFERAMCPDPHPGCDDCAAQFPPEAVAICGATGHCQVAYRGPTGP